MANNFYQGPITMFPWIGLFEHRLDAVVWSNHEEAREMATVLTDC
jgi:hypothetical protein